MEALRVLQVVSSSKNSGAERHVALLSEMLRRRGHAVSVACPEGWLTEALAKAGIEAHPIEMRKKGPVGALLRLVSLADRDRFDLIHAHLTRATYHGATAAFFRRIPIVTTAHIFSRDPIFRVLAYARQRLIAVSDSVRGAWVAAGVPADAVDVVYNGTDFGDAAQADPLEVRREFGLNGRTRVIGLVGRVAKEKGHLIALGAARRVAERHPDAHFLFVGRMEPHFEREFREAVERNGVGERMTLTGGRDDVPRLMDAMDVVMLPTEKETFGIVAIEAMARGKPVVATRTGGLREVVRDGETGLLIDQDEERFAAAIGRLLSDPESRRRMGELGREWVRENFSHERMVEKIETVYHRALRRRKL